MNKDLDDRLMPEGEYRDALNVSINKSQGDGSSEGNVGTLQTVLGNQLLQDISVNGINTFEDFQDDSEFIGVLPSDNKNSIYAFVTNNTLTQDQAFYVPKGAVGLTYLYPNNQGSSDSAATLTDGGQGYVAGTTYNTSGGAGTGMTIRVDSIASATDTSVVTFTIINSGTGYNVNDFIQIVIPGGTQNAVVVLTSVVGPITLTAGGTGYVDPIAGTTTTTGGGSGLRVSCTILGTTISSVTVIAFGAGYQVGDVVTIDGGNNDATFTIDYLMNSFSAIISYNLADQTNFKVIAEGAFLNFSTQNQIYGINLIEDLLFFTDNRNQPRKVNINRPTGYYTTEEQISVAKYYPCDAISLYQPSEAQSESGLSMNTATSTATTNSTTLNFSTSGSGSGAPSNLGVLGSIATITPNGTSYSNLPSPSSCTGGTGRGTTVNYTHSGGVVQTVTIVNLGEGHTNGDILTISSGDNNATFVLNFITPDTFVIDSSGWPNTVIVNNPQTIPAGMTLNFVTPETTMQDASDLYLPASAEATLDSYDAAGPSIDILPATYEGFFAPGVSSSVMVGYHLYFEYNHATQPGVFTDSGAKVTSVTQSNTTPFDITIALSSAPSPLPPSPVPAEFKLRLALPNPYYDSDFAATANVEYLTDKFTRFSYRFKYDDGEYSLMAPFTQPCFIPEQDGYFIGRETLQGAVDFDKGENEVSDEENAYRSTEVSFMENKVNKITLNIPLPCAANDLTSLFKIQELDILYKESDQTTIKVVDSIPVQGSISGNSPVYQYEYGSKPPFKTLPQAETVRVYDKVPVKALSQEVASNRVIYGNFQNKHTPPAFLDYILSVNPKQTFNISQNTVNSDTSEIEYPNATLKQNRTYEVGIVLSDKFGRQSTVLFSKQSEYAALGEFLASSIYSPYRGEFEPNPTEGITAFDGNALNVQFNSTITSLRDTSTGSPGIYNGDINSQDYNPLGWYSFKVVVKQTEQEYYNVYIPTAMAAYPLNTTKELTSTSHIVLYNDNINKIPRDLTEVGPTQKDFPSSVRMFGRVGPRGSNNVLPNVANNRVNAQFYPSKIADITTNVATIRDLFDYENFPLLQNTDQVEKYVFYNFDYLKISGAEGDFPDSSSLVARINTQKKFGVQVPRGGVYAEAIVKTGSGSTATINHVIQNILPSPSSATYPIITGQRVFGEGINNNVTVLQFTQSTTANEGTVKLSSPVVSLAGSTWQFSGGSLPYTGTPALNVYEITPSISLIDIYYETTTSGLIKNLNDAIDQGPPPNILSQLDGFYVSDFKEDNVVPYNAATSSYEKVITTPFAPVTQSGTTFPDPTLNIVRIDSITDQRVGPGNNSYNGVPYFDATEAEPNGTSNGMFGIRQSQPTAPNGKFVIILKKKTSPGAFARLNGSTTSTTFDIDGLTSAKSWPTDVKQTDNTATDLAGFRPMSTTPDSDDLVGASVSGSVLIPPGTVVTGFTPTGIGAGSVTISNAPTGALSDNSNIVFGKESPGLVFSQPNNVDNLGAAGNTFTFNFLCSNSGIDSSTGLELNPVPTEVRATLDLSPVTPKRPKVIIKSKLQIPGTTNNQIDVKGDVKNTISSFGLNGQNPQPIKLEPEAVLNNFTGQQNQTYPILATVDCINGSSTFDLQREDLTLDIRRMFWAPNYAAGPSQWKWEEIGLNDWSQQNLELTVPDQLSGFPISNPDGSALANDINSIYNDKNNHWFLEQVPQSSDSSVPSVASTSFYNLRAGILGADTEFNKNVAYCLEIAAKDAESNSNVTSPSTFVPFVLSTPVQGFFPHDGGRGPVPIDVCGVGASFLTSTIRTNEINPFTGEISGLDNDELFGSWAPDQYPITFISDGPVKITAFVEVISYGTVHPVNDFILNTGSFTQTFTATDADANTYNLINIPAGEVVTVNDLYPSLSFQTQTLLPGAVNLSFQGQYSLKVRETPGFQGLHPAVRVALKLTIQVCAVAT